MNKCNKQVLLDTEFVSSDSIEKHISQIPDAYIKEDRDPDHNIIVGYREMENAFKNEVKLCEAILRTKTALELLHQLRLNP